MMTDIVVNTGNHALDLKIREWLDCDRNSDTREQILGLLADKNLPKLASILLKRISFGTAGLRGRMGAGFACMNDLVIIQTSQGLLKYLKDNDTDNLLKDGGVVIGYDGRYNSRTFAKLTATVFINAGVPVHLFSEEVATPFVPFVVTRCRCAAGVMVTASHNPKDDNGYKVYGSNGCQIISPADKNIETCILENCIPLDSSWNTDILSNHNLISDPSESTLPQYFRILKESIPEKYKKLNLEASVAFTYTPVHGVGYKYIRKCFNDANLTTLTVVEEQKDIDPNFSTVKYPNPEEGRNCLDLAINTANKTNSRIILANDPDADRLAIAEKSKVTNEWKIFNGNEIGALLGYWLLKLYCEQHPDADLSNVYMLSSTVSSKILQTMATAKGFKFVETLTGFKWMGNASFNLIKNDGCTVLFAFEEAIGFMCGSTVLDKDGISAAVYAATFISYVYQTLRKSLTEMLDDIYREFGYHFSDNSYFICYDPNVIYNIFDRLRNFNSINHYPITILNGKYRIKYIRDLTTGYDNERKDHKAVLPLSKSSQMITFTFENGLIVTLRTSGTEPKIKYYSEMCSASENWNIDEIKKCMNEMVDGIINEFLQPKLNKLIGKV